VQHRGEVPPRQHVEVESLYLKKAYVHKRSTCLLTPPLKQLPFLLMGPVLDEPEPSDHTNPGAKQIPRQPATILHTPTVPTTLLFNLMPNTTTIQYKLGD